MNKYRYVEECDYGGVYQCLKCKERWVGMNDRWKFCPFCGTQWKGQHECKTHDERWDGFKFNRYVYGSCWVFSSRAHWRGHPPHEWTIERALDGRYPAREVLEILQLMREDLCEQDNDSFRWEVKVELGAEPNNKYVTPMRY